MVYILFYLIYKNLKKLNSKVDKLDNKVDELNAKVKIFYLKLSPQTEMQYNYYS